MRNEIQVNKTAHYYTLNSNKPYKEILFVIHGYAQLASQFINEFSYLENKKVLVVAPEALSTFYGKDRTPVCSWMTSHERENEINDYNNYLNQIFTKYKCQSGINKLTVLGFSQGTSTALRWINQLEEKDITAHICSGSFPPEINSFDQINNKISDFYFYYGNNDRLMKPDQAEIATKKLNELNINFNEIRFEGKHEITEQCHNALLAEFN